MKKLSRWRRTILLLVPVLIFLVSCKKKTEDPKPTETETPTKPTPVPIPVYTGNVANMADDTSRIAMFKLLMETVYSGNTKGATVDSVKLRKQLYNTDNPFYIQSLNEKTGISISQDVNPTQIGVLKEYFKQIAEASKSSSVTASDGVAGLILNVNDIKFGKLFDTKGIALYHLIEKNLMGSFQFYKIVQLTAESKVTTADTASNLKNWDMAFAHLGVPMDFGNKNYYYSIPRWGKYLKVNDAKLGGSISKIMNAFASGRQAILQKNKATVLANAQIIKDEMEKATASLVVTSLNAAKYYNDQNLLGERNASLSEALSFLYVLTNLSAKKIPDAKLNEYIAKLNGNNWTLPMTDVTNLNKEFCGIYGLDIAVFVTN